MALSNSQPDTSQLSDQSSAQGNDAAAGSAETTPSAAGGAGEINLPTLAYKVYLLLKQELKLEQERLGHSRRF